MHKASKHIISNSNSGKLNSLEHALIDLRSDVDSFVGLGNFTGAGNEARVSARASEQTVLAKAAANRPRSSDGNGRCQQVPTL